MKTSFPIYLRRHKKRGHDETIVHIDWDGVDEKDLKRLASFYVLHRVESELKDWDTALPESVEYRAADFLHNEPLITRELEIPEKWKEPPKSKAGKELEKALAMLTPEEIAQLFSEA